MSHQAAATPEQKARAVIDEQLAAAGWVVQDRDEANLAQGRGVVVRELGVQGGAADYVLYVDRQAVGIIEAKKAGHTLSGVERQASEYSQNLREGIDAPIRPLPFVYVSNGVETRFTNLLDPAPRPRRVYCFHRPETIAEWTSAETLDRWVKSLQSHGGVYTSADDTKPSTLRSRLQTLPPVEIPNLWPNKVTALTNLEQSLKHDMPRALIQMATGSGKTKLAVTAAYRLIKFAGARRILFLVDRANLAEQTLKEFQSYWTPDDNRQLTELYPVQRLQANTIAASSKVVITTIQRLYSILRGEPELDEAVEESSMFIADAALPKEPLAVVYSAAIPPEYFDVLIVDECHRSIYALWRQVLEYFDAYLIGLTATPAKHTLGFFNQNLVMEYPHEQAVADGCNVDSEIYTIRTRITAQGSVIEAGSPTGYRQRRTRALRWQDADEEITYGADALDRDVVAKDQIRLVIRTFRDRLFTEIFPGRREVPKTLVFAKDDSHAEDIIEIVWEEFGRGSDFCQKITYRTTGKKPSDLIQEFRNGYNPRIAVTVDMVATGTDIKPVECVIFMRSVKSRVLFEQMKGRGVRVIDSNDLRAVTPDAVAKTHFVIVDCVGVTESPLADTQPLERKRSVSLDDLLGHVAVGGLDPDYLSSLASRLARLDRRMEDRDRDRVVELSGGLTMGNMVQAIVTALDPDRQVEQARADSGITADAQPTEAQVVAATKRLLRAAVAPLATKPKLRKALVELHQTLEQVIDEVSKDELLAAGAAAASRDRASALVRDFETFIRENKDELDALQFFYSVPYRERLRFTDIKALHEAIERPPRRWTEEKLWRAYEAIETSKVRGAGAQRRLTDIVSLVRFALRKDGELVPYGEQVRGRFERWLAGQESRGRRYTVEQRRWLVMMRDHIAQSLEIDLDDFDFTPFVEHGGLGKAAAVFGTELRPLLDELNKVLAA